MAKPTGRPVREELLAAATKQIQRVGVNAFSYGDLAAEVGISAPTIHHHFRTKDDLVAAVSARYRSDFAARVGAIDSPSSIARVAAYAELFEATAAADLHCLCGAMAADWMTIGEASRREVSAFFGDQASWLRAQVLAGITSGEFCADLDAESFADTLLAALEGSMLVTRAGPRRPSASTITAALLDLAASDR